MVQKILKLILIWSTNLLNFKESSSTFSFVLQGMHTKPTRTKHFVFQNNAQYKIISDKKILKLDCDFFFDFDLALHSLSVIRFRFIIGFYLTLSALSTHFLPLISFLQSPFLYNCLIPRALISTLSLSLSWFQFCRSITSRAWIHKLKFKFEGLNLVWSLLFF